jgi:hypothetical protein
MQSSSLSLSNVIQVNDGTLEDLLTRLHNEPYRRADGNRRSQRRKGGPNLSTQSSEISV